MVESLEIYFGVGIGAIIMGVIWIIESIIHKSTDIYNYIPKYDLQKWPYNLRLLANWFDNQYHDGEINDEVQRDLRHLASVFEKILEE